MEKEQVVQSTSPSQSEQQPETQSQENVTSQPEKKKVNKRLFIILTILLALLLLVITGIIIYIKTKENTITKLPTAQIKTISPTKIQPSLTPTLTPTLTLTSTPTSTSANESNKFYITLPDIGKWVIMDKAGNEVQYNPPPGWGNSYYIAEDDYNIIGAELPAQEIDLTIYGDGRYISINLEPLSSNGKVAIKVNKNLKATYLSDFSNMSSLTVEIDKEEILSSYLAKVSISSMIEQNKLDLVFDGRAFSIGPTAKSLDYHISFQTNEDNIYRSESVNKLSQDTHIITPVSWENLKEGIAIKAE